MEIQQSSIRFRTRHHYEKSRSSKEELRIRTPSKSIFLSRSSKTTNKGISYQRSSSDVQTIDRSSETNSDFIQRKTARPKVGKTGSAKLRDYQTMDEEAKAEVELVASVLEGTFDTEIQIQRIDGKQVNRRINKKSEEGGRSNSQSPESEEGGEAGNVAVRYVNENQRKEHEFSTVEATGKVKTSDGKTIDVDVHLNMERKLSRTTRFQFQAGNQELLDPLVVNYNRPSTELKDETFSFDLNADGVRERISMLKPGSGFLVMDRNGNGVLDDGSELFGPRTGKGFQELKSLDSDQNGVIDGGDPAFDQLYVMNPEFESEPNLKSLSDLGIGALFLKSEDSPFHLKRQNFQLKGKIKRSGLYVRNDGRSGTIQEVDLADLTGEKRDPGHFE